MKELPGISTRREGFNKRLLAVQNKKKESINLPSELKKWMKKNYPGYVFRISPNHFIFTENLTKDVNFLVMFEKYRFYGLGKAFTLPFGIEITGGQSAGFTMSDNFFRLFGAALQMPCWTYDSKTDLFEIFEGLKDLFDTVVPVFRSRMLHFFSPVPGKIPGEIPNQGAVTAQQGLGLALKKVSTLGEDLKLSGIFLSGIRWLGGNLGTCITPGGVLTAHGAWKYFFQSEEESIEIEVNVPSVGTISVCPVSRPFGVNLITQPRCRFPGKWMDSDEAMRLAEERVGKKRRDSGDRCLDILVKTIVPGNKTSNETIPYWEVRYLLINKDGNRSDKVITFNCTDGSDVLHLIIAGKSQKKDISITSKKKNQDLSKKQVEIPIGIEGE